uniref:Ankyrin repeat domain-containing protein 22-like n=1 Tax=Salarias fasciatus TaxID=181472 RepID=A0A672JD93_SALFA
LGFYCHPTCQAAYDGDVQRLYQLLKEDPSQIDVQEEHNGDTPLIAACRRGNLRTVKYLLENKADIHRANKKNRTCVHYVARKTFSVLDYLMIAILMPVLLLGYFIMLQKQRENAALMEVLLNASANVNAVDKQGNTPLHYACQRKKHRLVPVLLRFKAKTSLKNKDGETPMAIAKRLRFNKIIAMLRKRY